jgi:hypothetical protein
LPSTFTRIVPRLEFAVITVAACAVVAGAATVVVGDEVADDEAPEDAVVDVRALVDALLFESPPPHAASSGASVSAAVSTPNVRFMGAPPVVVCQEVRSGTQSGLRPTRPSPPAS